MRITNSSPSCSVNSGSSTRSNEPARVAVPLTIHWSYSVNALLPLRLTAKVCVALKVWLPCTCTNPGERLRPNTPAAAVLPPSTMRNPSMAVIASVPKVANRAAGVLSMLWLATSVMSPLAESRSPATTNRAPMPWACNRTVPTPAALTTAPASIVTVPLAANTLIGLWSIVMTPLPAVVIPANADTAPTRSSTTDTAPIRNASTSFKSIRPAA